MIIASERVYFIIPLPVQTCEKMFNSFFYHHHHPHPASPASTKTIKHARLINGIFTFKIPHLSHLKVQHENL